jgi:dTDP-4-dehydrorhamnose reductase
MKVLVLGGSGMLGHKLVQSWRDQFDVWTTLRNPFHFYSRFNIFDSNKTLTGVSVENFDSVTNAFAVVKPDVIVNCTGIIKQVSAVKDPIQTLTINSIFPHRLAQLCAVSGARLITLSTDCVFNGRKGNYNEEDTPDADDLYGRSKNLGEVSGQNCLTLRTSIIGRELESSHSLIEWFLANKDKTVKGFVNAIYTGFPTIVLADILADIIENQQTLNGIWHVSSEPINKYELLKLTRDAYSINIDIEPFKEFYLDRSLDSNKFRAQTGFKPESWQTMIARMAKDRIPQDGLRNTMQ